MPDRSRKKRPRDANKLAKRIVDLATGEVEEETKEETKDETADSGKNPAAVALGRLGGKKGGRARAEKLTPEQRSAIAKRAAAARWSKKNDS